MLYQIKNLYFMVLTKLYNEFKDINNEVANIHYGGCGVFAEHTYNTLVKS